MAMSWHEVVAVLVGLGGGYWLVSRVIEGKDGAEPRAGFPGDGDRDTRGDGNGRADFDPYGTGAGRSDRADPPPGANASGASRPWWEVLEVPRIATRDEVARAYKRKISEYHPDKVARMGDEIRALAERRSKEINAAYDEALRQF
jgi:hypothetical protein